ncbi:MAG TPA: hypothetical protein VNZ45_04330 [Bacteroidia bacterium]|nr:hypothetical protein [Bacteroidia bacterium]
MSDHKRPRFGATGKFPQGKLDPNDEGELSFGIGNDGKLVHVNFGKPVIWFALEPDDAIRIGNGLIEQAKAIKASIIIKR